MAFGKLRKWLEGAAAQVNPFDNGKTFDTVTNNKPVGYRQQVPADVQQKIRTAKYGPLANNPQAQDSFLKSNTFEGFSPIHSVLPSLKEAGTQVGLGGLRSLTGTAQGLSGLYDLATPGTGTNRVSNNLNKFAKFTDQTAKQEPGSPIAYKGGQFAGDALTFLAGGEVAKGLANAPKVAKYTAPTLNVADKISNPIVNSIATHGAGGRILASGVKATLSPSNIANTAAFTGLTTGADASKGRDISAKGVALNAGQNLAMNAGLPMLGRAAAEIPGATKSVASGGLKIIREAANPTTAEMRQLQAQKQASIDAYHAAPSGRVAQSHIANVNNIDRQLAALQQRGGARAGDILPDKAFKEPKPPVEPARTPAPGQIPVESKLPVENNVQPKPNAPTSPVVPSGVSDGALHVQQPTSLATPKAGESFNLSKANVPETTKKSIASDVADIAPDIQARVGSRLSLKEVKDYAGTGTKVVGQARTKAQTLEDAAALHRTQQRYLALKQKEASGQALTPKEVQQMSSDLLNVQARKADIARQLGSLRNIVDPKELTMRDVMISRIAKEVNDFGPVEEALKRYDLNDPAQANAFYREFIKPNAEDWLDKYRYTNMLSSPKTHIVNTASNLIGGAVVHPLQKATEGFIDAVVHHGDRSRYAGEALPYMKGFFGSMGEAATAFKEVMQGKRLNLNPDMDALRNVPLATKGAAAKADSVLSVVTKLLEAGDQFSTALVKGGELKALEHRAGKGVVIKHPEALAQDIATQRLFRSDLGGKEQGYILQAMDYVPQQLNQARHAKNPIVRNVSKIAFPFVKTPTNIFKQMLEYSPAGYTTMAGSSDKIAAAAKATMGTVGTTLIASTLASNGNLTFSEPSGKERDAFRAAGKQPYSFKIGNTWISYQRLHPAIAMNFAVVASVTDALNKKKINEKQADVLLEGFGGMVRFFTDQSYVKNVRDFVDAASGGANTNTSKISSTISSQAGNAFNQLVPFRSMATWINNIVDPTQRKVDYSKDVGTQIYQQAVKGLPGLSHALPTRDDPFTGQPVKSDVPFLNAVSPANVSIDKGYGNIKLSGSSSASTPDNMSSSDRIKLAMRSPEAQKFLSLSAEDQKAAASSDPRAYKLYQDKQAIQKAFGSPQVHPPGLGQEDVKTLDHYNRLTDKAKERLLYSKNDAEYKLKLAEYNQKRLNGEYHGTEAIKEKNAVDKLRVGKDFSKDTRDFYGLNKGDLWDYLSTEEKGVDKQKTMNDILAYDDALVKAGVISKNKFRDKYGNPTFNTGGSGGKGGRKGRGVSLSGIDVSTKDAPKSFGIKVASAPKPSGKMNVPKGIRVAKAKRAKIGGGKIRQVKV